MGLHHEKILLSGGKSVIACMVFFKYDRTVFRKQLSGNPLLERGWYLFCTVRIGPGLVHMERAYRKIRPNDLANAMADYPADFS